MRRPLEPKPVEGQTRDLILTIDEVDVIIRSLSDSYNRTDAEIYNKTLQGMFAYRYTLTQGTEPGESKY